MEAFGASEDVIEQQAAAEAEAALLAVHEDNVQTVLAFVALATQWRVSAVGVGNLVYLGLDYAAIPAVLSLLGVARRERAEVFAGLQLMERVALPLRNERKDRGDV